MKAISNRVAVTAACIALTIQAAVVIPTVVAVWWFAGGSGEEAAEDVLIRNVAVDTVEGRSLVGKIGRSREGWHWFHPETERQSPYAFAEARYAARGLVSMSRYSHSGGSTKILSVRPVTVSGEPVGWVEEWAAPNGEHGWRYVEPLSEVQSGAYVSAEVAAWALANIVPASDGMAYEELRKATAVRAALPLD